MVFPLSSFCPLCGLDKRSGLICNNCRGLIDEYQKEARCIYCGRFYSGKHYSKEWQEEKFTCPECQEKEWPFAIARAVGPYEGILKEAVHRLKYQKKRDLAEPLGQLMAEVARRKRTFLETDLVIPVPLSRQKMHSRGFNQSALLAKYVSLALNKSLEISCLTKVVETTSQVGLSKNARIKNPSGVFTVYNQHKIARRKVLLIDDVFTTGYTMAASASALKMAGAKEVFALTLATGRRRNIMTKSNF